MTNAENSRNIFASGQWKHIFSVECSSKQRMPKL